MKPGHLLTVVRVALTATVFACAALVVDYKNPQDPAFCGVNSSCMEVWRSKVGQQMAEYVGKVAPGMLVPQLALFIFLGLLAFTFFLRTRLHVYMVATAYGIGAVLASYLIYTQAKIDAFCKYCMIVDIATIIGAIAALALALVVRAQGIESEREWQRRRKEDEDDDDDRRRVRPDPNLLDESLLKTTDVRATIAWGIAGTLVTALPFIWERFPVVPANAPMPAQIEALQEPGKTTVVTFTDFECPYCRRLHEETKEALHKDPKVVIKRFMVPLPFHLHAYPAALAYVCTPPEKQDEVADTLYSTPPEELTFDGAVNIAIDHGAGDKDAVVDCFASEATKKRLESDSALFDQVNPDGGVPLTWVGNQVVRGAGSKLVIEALDRNAGPRAVSLPVWMLFLAAGIVIVSVVVWTHSTPSEEIEAKPLEVEDAPIEGVPPIAEPSDEKDEVAEAADEPEASPEPAPAADSKLAVDEPGATETKGDAFGEQEATKQKRKKGKGPKRGDPGQTA